MTEPLTDEELESIRTRAADRLRFEPRSVSVPRLLATIDARDAELKQVKLEVCEWQEAKRQLEWLVGEKDKKIALAMSLLGDLAGGYPVKARVKLRAAHRLTVADYPKERPWPGYCQSCKAPLDPPDRTSCLACGVSDTDES